MELLPTSIGIGLAISLMFSELFGLAAGGMVVPGYVALYLNRPIEVMLTILVGCATYAIVHSISLVAIVFGKRRTVLMILIGYLLGSLLRAVPPGALGSLESLSAVRDSELGTVGYIIPGLIGIWIDRQGLVETISVLLTAAVCVRLILVLFLGGELHP